MMFVCLFFQSLHLPWPGNSGDFISNIPTWSGSVFCWGGKIVETFIIWYKSYKERAKHIRVKKIADKNF